MRASAILGPFCGEHAEVAFVCTPRAVCRGSVMVMVRVPLRWWAAVGFSSADCLLLSPTLYGAHSEQYAPSVVCDASNPGDFTPPRLSSNARALSL